MCLQWKLSQQLLGWLTGQLGQGVRWGLTLDLKQGMAQPPSPARPSPPSTWQAQGSANSRGQVSNLHHILCPRLVLADKRSTLASTTLLDYPCLTTVDLIHFKATMHSGGAGFDLILSSAALLTQKPELNQGLMSVCASAVSAPSTYGEVPGGAGRWTLADDSAGLNSMAAMYASVNTMSNQITLFTTLQGITLQLLIMRLIRVLSAQKRLSILPSTGIKVQTLQSSCCTCFVLSGMSISQC